MQSLLHELSVILLLNLYSICFFVYFLLGLFAALYVSYANPKLDRSTFLLLGAGLLFFTLLRPLPLSRDDVAYISIAKSICAINVCGLIPQGHRDWLWYVAISALKSVASDKHSLMALAAVSTCIKLFVIDRLCKQKLLALLLLIPLIYIQYDFTQLRAGLALSWYFLGLLVLIKGMPWLGSGFMVSNFLFHAQALPSIGVLPISWLNQRRWVLPIAAIALALAFSPTSILESPISFHEEQSEIQ